MQTKFAFIAVCVALSLSSCGGGESPAKVDSAASAAEATTIGARTVDGKTKPIVKVPDIPRPTKLIVRDLKVGDGRKATVGDEVKVMFVGVNWAGETYADTWGFPSPPVFNLGGAGQRPEGTVGRGPGRRLEYGLDLGLRGMREGGRRKVISPSRLLYWPDEPHGAVKPINTFVFVVDLIEVRRR